MFGPEAADRGGIEIAVTSQAFGRQQILSPFAQGAAQPVVDRHREAHFGPLDQCPGHMAVEHLAQQPLRYAAAQLHGERQGPGEGHDAMIQQGHPSFQADGHGGAVDLGQNVVGHIGHGIQIHHRVGRVRQIGALMRGQPATPVQHHGFGLGPMAGQAFVHLGRIAGVQDTGQLVQFVAWIVLAQIFRQTVPLLWRQGGQQGGQGAFDGTWQPAGGADQALYPKITVVTAKNFVSTIPGQDHGDFFPGHF